MDNNEIYKRLRYALQIDDPVAIRILKQGGLEATLNQVSAWRLDDAEPEYAACPNEVISAFIAGYIVERRGVREGKPVPSPSTSYIENNTILKTIKIALDMRSEDVESALASGGASLTAGEVNALLRKPGSRNYRQCGDQALRHFINGIGILQRDSEPTIVDPKPTELSTIWSEALKKKK